MARVPRGAFEARLGLTVVNQHGNPAEVFVTEGVGHARDLAKAAVAARASVAAWAATAPSTRSPRRCTWHCSSASFPRLRKRTAAGRASASRTRDRRCPGRSRGRWTWVESRVAGNTAGAGFDAHIASRFAASRRRGLRSAPATRADRLRAAERIALPPERHRGSARGARELSPTSGLEMARSSRQEPKCTTGCWISWWWRSNPDSPRFVQVPQIQRHHEPDSRLHDTADGDLTMRPADDVSCRRGTRLSAGRGSRCALVRGGPSSRGALTTLHS